MKNRESLLVTSAGFDRFEDSRRYSIVGSDFSGFLSGDLEAFEGMDEKLSMSKRELPIIEERLKEIGATHALI